MEERSPAVSRAWWREPFGTAALGVALMVGGWLVMTYTPDGSGRGLVNDIRRWAAEQAREEGVAGLHERLPPREAPYQLPGRFVMLAGVVLFVAAGVRMWRKPEAGDGSEAEEEDEL